MPAGDRMRRLSDNKAIFRAATTVESVIANMLETPIRPRRARGRIRLRACSDATGPGLSREERYLSWYRCRSAHRVARSSPRWRSAVRRHSREGAPRHRIASSPTSLTQPGCISPTKAPISVTVRFIRHKATFLAYARPDCLAKGPGEQATRSGVPRWDRDSPLFAPGRTRRRHPPRRRSQRRARWHRARSAFATRRSS